jgi:ABC-type thiamine transport system substrate-binding protein
MEDRDYLVPYGYSMFSFIYDSKIIGKKKNFCIFQIVWW